MLFTLLFFIAITIALIKFFPRKAFAFMDWITGKREIIPSDNSGYLHYFQDGTHSLQVLRFEYYPFMEKVFPVDFKPIEIKIETNNNECQFIYKISRPKNIHDIMKLAKAYGEELLSDNVSLIEFLKPKLQCHADMNKSDKEVSSLEIEEYIVNDVQRVFLKKDRN